MGKQSKVTVSSKPDKAAPLLPTRSEFYCVRCGRTYKHQQRNFPSCKTPMWRVGNNGYLPVCNFCVDELFDHYRTVLSNDKEAMKRVCSKFDIYWHPDIYATASRDSHATSRIRAYIKLSCQFKWVDKSYDDTLDEEAQQEAENQGVSLQDAQRAEEAAQSEDNDEEEIYINPESIRFWGPGLKPEMYEDLDIRYDNWRQGMFKDAEVDASEQAVLKQICIAEMQINRKLMAGENTDRDQAALNTMLGSANLKPVQKKDPVGDAAIENNPFGCWIQKIEETEPIPEPDPEFEDADGIWRYVSIWFLGHLCKMCKINNRYSQMYEAELRKLSVERPEYEGEDEEAIFDDIFSRANDAKENESSPGENGGDSGDA